MKNFSHILRSVAVFVLTKLVLAAMIIDARGLAAAVVSSIEVCLYTIIPALFGFMFISSLLLKSGFYKIAFKPFYLLFRRVVRLDEEEFGIFLLSLFGGYPVGAKLISEKARENSENAYDILPFCYCPSPGFVIAIVGVGVFANPAAGLIVYISNALTCLILAIAASRRWQKPLPSIGGSFKLRHNSSVHNTAKSAKTEKIAKKRPTEILTSSILSASSALFPICAVVTAFGVLTHVLRFYGIGRFFALLGTVGDKAETAFFSLLEISNAAALPPDISLLPIIAALFSFGGLCVIMQIPAITKAEPARLKKFLLARIPAAIISAVICRILLSFVNLDGAAFSIPAILPAAGVILPSEAKSPIASAALLIMSVILVRTVNNSDKYSKTPQSDAP